MRKIIFQIFIIVLLLCINIYGSGYKGEKINLVFKDADLKNVLMLFAEYEDKNFLIDEKINGKITIRLKDVPWDQALEIILDSKDLAKIVEGNVIRIIPPLTISIEDLDKGVDLIEQAIRDVIAGKVSDDVLEFMRGW